MTANSSRRKTSSRRLSRLMAKIRDANLAMPPATGQEAHAAMLRVIARDKLKDDRVAELYVCKNVESDRGCVLVAAALMDNCLEEILKAHFSAKAPSATKMIASLFEPNKEQD